MGNHQTINLVVHNVIEYVPEEREWPTIEVDGEERELRPSQYLTVLPAAGWRAVFVGRDNTGDITGEIVRKPVACFALRRDDDGGQCAVSLTDYPAGCLSPADDSTDFLGLEGPGEEVDWTEDLYEWVRSMAIELRDITDREIHSHEN